MFSSTIIPTVGRKSLARSVESVLNQDFELDQFEIIIVNDSGNPLQENASWQKSKRVKVLNTNQRERSFARNTGAATAQGKYLHFLDDDDWIAADAIKHIYELSETTNAKWLYGESQLVDRDQKPLVRLQHGLNGNCFTQVMAGEWIPLQASWIEAKNFFEVGGFNQLITGPEDIDLLRRMAMVWDLAETPYLTAYIVRDEISTTTNFAIHPEKSRWAREKIIQDPQAFRRLQSSATSNYWRGRILRLYLTSLFWNLQRKHLLVAFERGLRCTNALFFAGSSIFSRDYWRAISKPYESFAFKKGLLEADSSRNK